MTEHEIQALAKDPPELGAHFCQYLIYFLIGYLQFAPNDGEKLEAVRQTFFGKIQREANKQRKGQHEADVSTSDDEPKRKRVSW